MGLLGIGDGGDSIEIANQEGENGGCLDMGPQGGEEGFTGKTMVAAGGGMEVEKG